MIVYLGIGSNIDAASNIQRAMQALQQGFARVEFSSLYESEAVGFHGANFINLVARIEVELTLNELSQTLKLLENQLGRERGEEKFSSRIIDIDILLFGDRCCEEPVQLPRDEILHNAFVLWPLAELAPDLCHPGTDKTYASLWRAFDQSSQVIKRLPN